MPDTNEATERASGEETALNQTDALEAALARKEEELNRASRRITELERAAAELEARLATGEKALAETEQKLAEVEKALSLAVASYRAQVIEANPQLPAELIAGETVEAVDSSLQTARTIISKVKEGLEAEIRNARIPAGAPPQTPPDLSALSPREKIQQGISGF